MVDIGSVATISSLLIAFIVPFIGFLIDIYGRKPFIILTGITQAISLLIVSYTNLYPLIILSYALYTFSFMAGQPARGAMTAESVTPERMGEAFGLVTTPFFIARVLIPSLAGLSADIIGFSDTFLYGAIIIVIGVVIFAFLSVETLKERKPIISSSQMIKSLKPYRRLGWLYLGAMIDRFAWALWMPLLNAYLATLFNLSATDIGILNSIMGFSTLSTQYLLGRLIDRIGYFKGLALSEFTGLVSTALLSISQSIILVIISLISIGISISLWIPSYNNAVSLNTEEKYRALEYSKVNSYRLFIAIPAPYIGGYLYDFIGVAYPFISSSILMLITTLFFYYYAIANYQSS